MSKLKKGLITLISVGLIGVGTVKASDNDINKFSTEITYAKDNNLLKFRPFDYTSGIQRTDLMLGKKVKNFTIYGYWKSDSKDRSWIGTRIDYGKKFLEDKLTANIQLRLFKGLNKTANQLYIIPTISHKIKNLNIGLLGYGVKSEGKEPLFYAGPSAGMNLTNNLSMMGAYTKDVFSNSNMLYWKTNFKFE